jgi:hypothetical protein
MAAPSYTEDLTDISLMESGETGAAALNISGGGGGAPAFGADFGMQGAGCWDKAASNAERAILTNNAPGSGVTAAGVHIFQWGFVGTPGVLDTLVNRGVYVIAGTDASNYVQYHVDGLDTLGAQGRVGKCYVYRYVTTAQTGKIPFRTVTGTPGTPPDEFGYGINTTATVKGSNFGQDAHRYGTGGYITAGELLSAGDASDDPATFTGFNIQSDDNTNRWGILTGIGGTNFELQGRFVIGQNSSQVATACSFRDSNVNISLVDTVHAESDFTQIILDHADTWVEWNNVNITALGQINPGRLVVNSANPEFQMTGGTITDIGISTLRTNTTADGTTWRGSGEVTANGATLANSSIFHGSKIIDAQDETNYASPSAFNAGSGHAASDVLILDDGTRIVVDAVSTGAVTQFTVDSARSKVGGAILNQVSSDGSGIDFSLTPDNQNYTESSGLIWDTASDPNGELDGMTFGNLTPSMTHAIEFGTNVPTTMTLTNCDFGTDYSSTEDGSAGNETFWFRDVSPTSITLNLVGCTGNFGYKTDGANITIVADPVPTTVTVFDEVGAPLLGARVFLETSSAAGDLPFEEVVTITSSGTLATVSHTSHGIPDGKKVVIRGANESLYNGVFTITDTGANSYTYTMNGDPVDTATGTITASGVHIEDTTDSSGIVTESRTITLDQPLKGWARKAAGTRLYKSFPISGTVDNVTGFNTNVMLIRDN